MKNKKLPVTNQSGQAIVFIVGALATAFIFGVLASYLATTSIKKTAYTGQAEAALHAAEAGCRHALILDPIPCDSQTAAETARDNGDPTDCYFTLGAGQEDEASVIFWATDLAGGSNTYVIPTQIEQDETVQIDLTDLDGSNLAVYWCDSNNGETCSVDPAAPALELAVIYQSGGEYRLDRYAFDPEAATRVNNFSPPSLVSFDPMGSGANFELQTNPPITLPTDVEFIRVKSLYNDGNATSLAIQVSSGTIPSQGLDIRCQGTVGASTRTVQVTKENPYLSSIFDYVLFSGTDIIK